MHAITVSQLIISVRLGHKAEERIESQRVRIDILIRTNFNELLATGDLNDGINYSDIRRKIKEVAATQEFTLLETLGNAILRKIFEDPKASYVRIEIQKLDRWKDAIPGIFMSGRNTRGV